MGSSMDPYYLWLGIPPDAQPPDHYRLLGLERFETNRQVIQHAAQRQRLFLQSQLTGKYADAARTLLDEVTAAEHCLLSSGMKANYDAQLQHAPAGHDEPAWVIPAIVASATTFGVLCLVLAIALWIYVGRDQGSPAAVVTAESFHELQALQQAEADADAVDEPSGIMDASDNVEHASPAAKSEMESDQASPDDVSSGDAPRVEEPSAVDRAEDDTPDAALAGPADPDVRSVPSPATAVPPAAAETAVIQETAIASLPAPTATSASDRTAAAGSPSSGKAVPPSAQELAAARQQVEQSFGRPAAGAAASGDARRQWAQTLVAQAQTTEQPATRFAMLDEAARTAAEAGDPQLAFSAVAQLERGFEADTWPLKAEVVDGLARVAKTLEDRQTLAHLTARLADQAESAQRFELAQAMCESGLQLAKRLKDNTLQRRIANCLDQVDQNAALHKAASAAMAKLEVDANDPHAHLALGRYLCFARGDWTDGLAHLARGADAELAALARQELAAVHDDTQRLQLADNWYDWGRGEEGRQQLGAWSRAGTWYLDVQPRLAGESQQRVNQRLTQLAEALGGSSARSFSGQRLPWLDGPVGQLRTFEGHAENVTALAVSPSGRWLVSASEDRTVRRWHLPTGEHARTHATETGNLNGVAITPDERFVISNYDNNELRVWPAQENQPPGRIPTSARSPTGLLVTPDGSGLIWSARSRPPNILVWSLLFQRPIAQFGDGDSPNVIDLSADGGLLATGDSRGVVRVWDSIIGIPLYEFPAHRDAVTDVDLSPDGRLVASATFGEIRVIDLRRGGPVHTLQVPDVQTVAFSPDGRRLASGGKREEIYLWDVATGQPLASLKSESAFSDRQILRIAFLPDPRGLVSGATEGRIRLWRLPE